MDKERTFNAFRICITDRKCENTDCPYEYECEKVNSGKANSGYIQIPKVLALDVMQLLKEHDEQKRKWLRNIADNQLANAPTDTMDATSHTYYDGVWHGLQMAYEIMTGET